MIQLRVVSPHAEDVVALIEQLNAHTLTLFPPEFCYFDPPEVLARANCTMLGAYEGQEICGIGAVKFFADYGEIKRMFVPPQFRSRGISKLILKKLLSLIEQQGLAYARLETGEKHQAAISLYRKCGFIDCEPFGEYQKTAHNM